MIVDALLTYPSVVSRIGAPQIVALAVVAGSGMIALLLFYLPTNELEKTLLACAILGSPYIALLGMAFTSAVKERFGTAFASELVTREVIRSDAEHKA